MNNDIIVGEGQKKGGMRAQTTSGEDLGCILTQM